jgi:cyclic beta-1,2-glucan synthetase
VDFEKTYQYYAFGVPGLGLKRGLSEDLVISPYSTFMALIIDPQSCLRNIDTLERAGARGMYGFYEAIDYTKERLSSDEKHHVVKSFMAHHQGMSLLCINNLVNKGVFQDRFHSDPAIKAVELLLHERFPSMVPAIVPHQAEMSMLEHLDEEHEVSPSEILRTPHTEYPRTRLLSNGRYSVFVDNAGGGWSFSDRNVALTRWREDSVRNDYGTHIFVRDLDTKPPLVGGLSAHTGRSRYL